MIHKIFIKLTSPFCQSISSLYNSIYETALKNEIPISVIEQLIRIYFYDVDLQRRLISLADDVAVPVDRAGALA